MESVGSLPHLQEPVTCPNPQPDQSVPCLPAHFLKIYFNIILPSTPRCPKWSLFFRPPFPQTPCAPVLSLLLATCPAHLSLPNNIWWGGQSIYFIVNFLVNLFYLPHCRFRGLLLHFITQLDTHIHSVRIPRTSDRPVAEAHKTQQMQIPRRDSNPLIPVSRRPQTHTLDRSASGTGFVFNCCQSLEHNGSYNRSISTVTSIVISIVIFTTINLLQQWSLL